ncbi:MAG: MATE family efflux transporter [Bacteroidaceae bacterium]|nr:MATE family efflux transporter [Bacteroidaceae bacterium]
MINGSNTDQKRSSLLQKNILASFIIKGWSAVIVFLMTPVTLKCLGEYSNGVWLTISSVMLWIDNLDIGLGNGLRNRLSIYMAHGDTKHARSLISSTFAMLTYIIIPAMFIMIALVWLCNTYSLFNVDPSIIDNLDSVLTVTVILVCSTFIFKLIGNFYMGMQLPAVSNMLVATGQTLAYVGTLILYYSGSHSLIHIALVNTAAPLVTYLIAYPVTFWYKFPQLRPSVKLIDIQEAKEVMSMGVQFFAIQISSVVLFMTSNLLISKLFDPSMVTPYGIAYRYFSIPLVAFTVICMPFWNATTDAYERNDMEWIRRATKKLRFMTIGILIGMILMVAVSGIVYPIWIGTESEVDLSMTIGMAVYIFILIYSMRYSYFINGIGKLRVQLIFTVSAAIVFIPAAYAVVKWTNDIMWFIGVMCLVNFPGLIANRIQFNKLINGKATGIWNK